MMTNNMEKELLKWHAELTEELAQVEADLKDLRSGRKVRKETPTRFRKARSNASVASITKSIEEQFGLPCGSVVVYAPGERRCNLTVGKLREKWERHERAKDGEK